MSVPAAIVVFNAPGQLFSDRTTRDGTFNGQREFPTNLNKIISPGKKAIAIIQPDGNFVIRTGNFTEQGNPKRPDGTEETDPMKYGPYTTEVWSAASKFNLWPKIGLNKGFYSINFSSTDFSINGIGGVIKKFEVAEMQNPDLYQGQFSMILADDGNLMIRQGDKLIWQTKPQPIPPTPQQQQGQQNQQQETPGIGSFSNLFLFAAAAIGIYFFNRKK
jgi:hypothetical protein